MRKRKAAKSGKLREQEPLNSVPIKDLNIFRITEEPEGTTDSGNNDNIAEKLDLLKAEILKLGKSQLRTRTFAKSEYQGLREAIEAFTAGNDRLAEMVIEDLLSIADGLDSGIKAGDAISSPEIDSWLNGMKIVHERVMELLKKFDVKPLHSAGKPFDPSLHVAVAVEHTQEVSDNIVLEEQRRGYVRGDKVIRFAEVIVNKQTLEHAIQVEENDN